MILVLVLACGFCLAGCLGPPSSSFFKAGDVEGHPGTMTQSAQADSMAGGPSQNSGYADDTRKAPVGGEAGSQISIEQILSFTRALDENLRTGSEVGNPYTGGRSTAAGSQRSEYDGIAHQYSSAPPENELFASINILMSELERDKKLSAVTLEALMKKLGESSSDRKEMLKSILSDLARLGTWRGADQNYFSALEKQESGNQNIDMESIPKDSDIDTNDQYLPDASTEQNQFRPDSSSYVVRSEIDAEGAGAGDRSEGLVNDETQLDNLDFVRKDYPGGRKGRLDELLHRNMLQLEQMLKELKSNNTRSSNRLGGLLPDGDQQSQHDGEDPFAGGVDGEVGHDDQDEYLPYSIAPSTEVSEPGSALSDGEFQKTLSAYLDEPYLKRLRRDAEDYKLKFRQKMRARLSITYGHVVPCKYQDRFYCMNGGTCVFVDALTLKTCRCPVGYIGHRCMLIDQEYIFSLINQLISS